MDRQLRILFLEDSPADFEMELRELVKDGSDIAPIRVDTESEYLRRLDEFSPDLIIADYVLSSYNGLAALDATMQRHPEVPFIFVSATIGEETAIEALKRGATDFVIKDRLFRLRPAAQRALREAAEKEKLRLAIQGLRDSEALYQSLVENLSQCVFRKDVSGRFTFVNQRLCRLLDKSAEQILGRVSRDLFPAEQVKQYERDDRKVLESGEALDATIEFVAPQGEKRYMRLVKTPLRDAGDRIIGIQGIFWDITDTRLADQRIRQLNRLLHGIRDVNRLMVMQRNPGILLHEACETLVRNRDYLLAWIAAADLLSGRLIPLACAGPQKDYLDEITMVLDESPYGHGPEGLAIKKRETRVVNDVATDPSFAPWREAARARGYGSVAAFPLRQGERLFGALAVYADRPDAFDPEEIGLLDELSADVAFALQSIEDEKERKRAEERLRNQAEELIESELRYRELFENANDVIYTIDMNGHITSINHTGEKILGYTREEVMDMDISRIVAPEYFDQAQEIIRRTLAGKILPPIELDAVSKGGRRITFEVNNRAIVRDDEIIGLQGIGRDVSERNLLQRQLLQAQKMEAVGRLAGGIAHDFNNLLTIIIGYSDLLLGTLGPEDRARADLNQIKSAGTRAADLTAKLLAFSRKQIQQIRIIDLNTLIQENAKLLRRLIGEDIELITIPGEDLGSIRADVSQMDQVIMNLAVNARDATPDGGTLTLETANVELGDSFVHGHPGSRPGKFVMLALSDSGIGMDAETKSHIFEPFFTTKGEGKGTGLGLATVYGTVKQSGGYISVDSEPGRGTTFRIYLPRVDASAEIIEPEVLIASEGTETILLVEDMEELRSFALRALKEKGYTILTAQDGPSAIKLAEQYQDTIHLLITDFILPGGFNGRDLATRFHAARPETATLFISGHLAALVAGDNSEEITFLQKPFTGEALARKVREVLSAGAPEKSQSSGGME